MTTSSLGQAPSGAGGSRPQPAAAAATTTTTSSTTKRARKTPKRTSYPCVVCGRLFPTQQAMAGHSSAHTPHARARARTELTDQLLPAAAGHVVRPPAAGSRSHNNPVAIGEQSSGDRSLPAAVQGASATGRMPPVADVPYYPSSFPFVHPLSNQVMTGAPSCLAQPSPSRPLWMTAQHQIQAPAAQLGRTVLRSYDFMPMPWPCNATADAVPLPSPGHACSANQTGVVQADLTLGSGGGGGGDNRVHKRELLPLLEDGRRGKLPLVGMYGGDQSGEEGKDADDLDLELRL